MGFRIETYEDAKALNLGHLWTDKANNPSAPGALPEAAPPSSKFVSDGMNKTERRFSGILTYMKDQHDIKDWEFEPEKFRMADKTWYLPDFRVTLPDGRNVFVEVKVRKKDGSILWRDDAAVKCKTIAELHPYPLFLAVQGEGRWEVSRLPSRKWGWIHIDIQWRV